MYYGSDIPSHPWYFPYLNNAILYPCTVVLSSSTESEELLHDNGRCPGTSL